AVFGRSALGEGRNELIEIGPDNIQIHSEPPVEAGTLQPVEIGIQQRAGALNNVLPQLLVLLVPMVQKHLERGVHLLEVSRLKLELLLLGVKLLLEPLALRDVARDAAQAAELSGSIRHGHLDDMKGQE